MIVGIDLDHTISELPGFFRVLASALIEAGHGVHGTTYREPGTEERVHRELDELGIPRTQVHLPDAQAPHPNGRPEWPLAWN